MLLDLRSRHEDLTGADAEKWLEAAGMITNKNGIPNDPRPPKVTSGLRLGTPALTSRGLKEAEMRHVADWLDRVMATSLRSFNSQVVSSSAFQEVATHGTIL